MRNILVLTHYTLREALSRKIFIMFFGVSTFVLLLFVILFSAAGIEDMIGMVKIQGEGEFNIVAKLVEVFKKIVVIPLYGGGLFLSIFSVSSFIPNLLEKGNIDLLLSKPVSRNQIIWGKFLGGILVVLINIAYIVLGIWFLIGLKFSNWDFSFLITIPLITFAFSVLYSMIILIGILTRSSVLAMMLSYLIFFLLSPLLLARDKIMFLSDSVVLELGLDALYYFIPKTSELGSITGTLAEGIPIHDFQPIVSSLIFMVLSLALSIIVFSKKDY